MSSTAGLQALVVGPYRWNAATYSSFLRDVYDNVIKAEVERLQNFEVEKRKQAELTNSGKSKTETCAKYQSSTNFKENFDVEIANLVQILVDESGKVLGRENWTDIIGTDLWNVLKLDEHGKDRYKLDNETDEVAALKKKSVVQLLKFIRNKISHIRTCKDEVKERLTKFFDKEDKGAYKFNENNFIALWISKFPRLVPYLWIKLYKFKDTLANYYPDYEIDVEKLEHILLDLNKFREVLTDALFADMENGNVFKRYKGPDILLEFRGYGNIVKFLDKNEFVKVAVNSKENVLLSLSHSSTNDDTIDYEGSDGSVEKFVLIFTENITNNMVWKHCRHCDCKVIVFCDSDKLTNEVIEDLITKFRSENNFSLDLAEYPIMGTELSPEKQKWVFENGHVSIQGRHVKLKNIIPNRSKLLEEISGDFLNKILKQQDIKFCEKYKYQEYKGVYVKRRLYFTDAKGKQNVIHIKRELAKEDYLYGNEIVGKLHTKDMIPKHVCSSCVLGPFKKTRKIDILGERNFLKRICWKKLRTIYLLAESGMGKSKLLLSLGKMLKNCLVIFYSYRQFVNLLKKRVGTKPCSKRDVKCVILEILGCRDKCELNMIDKWLEQKFSKGAKIELQLDGLDEVPSGNSKLALKALEIIENDLHSIRVWITSSKPLPSVGREFRINYFSILPFSFKDKIDYFQQVCKAKLIGLTEENLKLYSLRLELILTADKEMVSFLDHPLNYSLLVELYEDDISKLTELTGFGVSVKLFDSLYQKKFVVMYREKKGINLDDEDDDFKTQRDNYLRLHTYLALVHLFPAVSNDFVEPTGMEYFTKENCHKMGIIINCEPVTFIHVKYADFLVAKYIMKVLVTGNLETLCPEKLFCNLLCFGTPKIGDPSERSFVWKFVDEYLGKISDWSTLKWSETHKFNNLSKICKEKSAQFLISAVKSEFWNLTRLLISLSVNESNKKIGNQILHSALLLGAPLTWSLRMCEMLSYDNQYDLLICSVQQGHYEIAKFLLDHKCGDDVFDKISEIRKHGGGILHCIADQINNGQSTTTILDIFNESFVKNITDFIRFIVEKSTIEIERRDSRGRTFLLALPLIQKGRESLISSELIFVLKEFLIKEMNVDINVTSFYGESILCMALDLNYQYEKFCQTGCLYKHCKRKADLKKVEIYHKTLALVTSKGFVHLNLKSNGGGLTPLQEAVYFFGSSLKKDSLEIFQVFDANFNELDGEGDTILHYCVKNCDDIEFIKLLVKCGSKINVKNGKHLCALCLAGKEGKYNLVKFFRKMLRLKRKQKCSVNCTDELY